MISFESVLSYTFFMSNADFDPKEDVQLFMENAREMLAVAALMIGNDFYSSACNRSYYAIFYAASALLATKQMAFGKHSAVLAAFRQHFVKTGEIDMRWSRVYERILSHRQTSDYDIHISIDKDLAVVDLQDAREFVQEVTQWLQEKKYLSI
jgi:uncharacterized protein (UPF0332 family)